VKRLDPGHAAGFSAASSRLESPPREKAQPWFGAARRWGTPRRLEIGMVGPEGAMAATMSAAALVAVGAAAKMALATIEATMRRKIRMACSPAMDEREDASVGGRDPAKTTLRNANDVNAL